MFETFEAPDTEKPSTERAALFFARSVVTPRSMAEIS